MRATLSSGCPARFWPTDGRWTRQAMKIGKRRSEHARHPLSRPGAHQVSAKSARKECLPQTHVIARSEATRRSRGHGLKRSVKKRRLTAVRAAPGSPRFARDDGPPYALTPIKWQIANTKSARFIV